MPRPPLYGDVVTIVSTKDERCIWGKVRELTFDDFLPGEWVFSYPGFQYTLGTRELKLVPELAKEMQEVGFTFHGSTRHSDWRQSECTSDKDVILCVHNQRPTRIIAKEKGRDKRIAQAIEKHKEEFPVGVNGLSADALIAHAIDTFNHQLARAWENRRYEALRRIGQAYAQYKVEDERLQPMYAEMQRLREARQKLDKESEIIVAQAQHARLDKAAQGDPEEFIKAAHEALDQERAARRHPFS